MINSSKAHELKKRISLSWHRALVRLFHLGGISAGNKITIFHDGDQSFLAIHNAISEATKSIYVETYILSADRLGLWIRDALIEASLRGVCVSVLYDHFGSNALGDAFLEPMKKAHIKLIEFNPIWPWRRRGPLLFRDHRNIIVVDKRLAFCGSMNISADYAGPIYGTNRFRDSVAQVEGPAVLDLLAITLESMKESEFVKGDYEKPLSRLDGQPMLKHIMQRLIKPAKNLESSSDADTMVQILRSNMRRNLNHIQKAIKECVNRSVSYCYFTTPYFLPSKSLYRAIIHAARRGVDIRILSAGISDVPVMRQASHHVYGNLLAQNVRIYEMNKKTLHAKLCSIDGIYASIGSYNLDQWSARRNLEVTMSTLDSQIALELKEQFHEDLLLAEELKHNIFCERSFMRKLFSWLCYLIVRI
jgi:cardiolipin synthase